MTESTTTSPAVGDPVVVLYGLPDSVTWDDSGAEVAGQEGVLGRILGEGWQDAPFEVQLPDGRTLMASRVRVIDDTYRAEKAAEKAADDRLSLRRLRILDAALHELGSDPAVPDEIRERLFGISMDTAYQAWREEQAGTNAGESAAEGPIVKVVAIPAGAPTVSDAPVSELDSEKAGSHLRDLLAATLAPTATQPAEAPEAPIQYRDAFGDTWQVAGRGLWRVTRDGTPAAGGPLYAKPFNDISGDYGPLTRL